jgi:hypothetical protein
MGIYLLIIYNQLACPVVPTTTPTLGGTTCPWIQPLVRLSPSQCDAIPNLSSCVLCILFYTYTCASSSNNSQI